MKSVKVLYILNNAPDYRDKFLTELGKYVDLTVAAYPGGPDNLKDPDVRENYNFIPLRRLRFAGINFNHLEFTLAHDDYDCIVVGFVLNSPFRLLNIFRKKRVIVTGLIYGKSNNCFVSLVRRVLLRKSSAILVYTELIKKKLESEIKQNIISFNNTYFKKMDITPLVVPELKEKLNIVWVGRYQERKKIERLYELAKHDSRVDVRVIGPGIRDAFNNHLVLKNFEIYDATHGDELISQFEWCHIVFNPGGAGLLVMNAARLGRGIVIDNNSHHGPEIQLALDAQQDFIDFSEIKNVETYIDNLFDKPEVLSEKAALMVTNMENYTVEFMVERYLEAIQNA